MGPAEAQSEVDRSLPLPVESDWMRARTRRRERVLRKRHQNNIEQGGQRRQGKRGAYLRVDGITM